MRTTRRKYILPLMISIAAMIFNSAAQAQNPSKLDQSIATLQTNLQLWTNLQRIDPSLNEQSIFRQIITQNFFERFAATCPVSPWQFSGIHPECNEVLEFRKALFEQGLPANLTNDEVILFEHDPQYFLFRPLDRVPLAGRFHGGGNFAERARMNGIYFLTDFMKAHTIESLRKPSYRFGHYIGISRVNADQAAAAIRELFPHCESVLAGFKPEPPPIEPAYAKRLSEARNAIRAHERQPFDSEPTKH